ncbi:MAG: PilZ domain-containing protein [Rhodospirillales bacterium]|nr:PilZ domain-containing protein [Rhodospirillales bacterium]
MSEDNRTFERFPIARLAFAESIESGETCCGVLKNISAGGAMIDLTMPFKRLDHVFTQDMPVDVTIDEFDALKGKVVRATQNSIGVLFNIDESQQDELMDKILSTMEKEGATAE